MYGRRICESERDEEQGDRVSIREKRKFYALGNEEQGDRVAGRVKGREICPENWYSSCVIWKSIAQGKRVVNKWVCGVCSHRKFAVDIGA